MQNVCTMKEMAKKENNNNNNNNMGNNPKFNKIPVIN